MKNKSVPGYKRVFAWMIAVFAMVIPWISYLRIWKLTDAQADVFENYNGYVFDFFLYYREVLLVVMAVVLLAVMIGENLFPDHVITQTPVRDRQNRKIWICFSVYTAAVLLSFLFSKNKGLALSGSPSEGEGVFVLIGYGILFFGAMNYFCYEETMRIFEKAMLVLCVVTIVLTAVEFFYEPVLKLPFIKNLIAPSKYAQLIDNMNTDNYKSYVSLTFYNPNYFGGFCLLLLPYAFKKLLISEKRWKTAGYILLVCGLLFSVTAAKSTASFYLAFAELIFLCAMEGRGLAGQIKKLLALILVAVVIFVLCNAASGGKLMSIGKNAITNESTANVQKAESTADKENAADTQGASDAQTKSSGTAGIFRLKDIRLEGNELTLKGENETLITVCNDGTLEFYDKAGEPLEVINDGNRITFSDSRFAAVSVTYSQNTVYYDLGYDEPADFYLQDDIFYGIGQNGALSESVTLNKRFGEALYPLFTGRGYAWVNTLPLLTHTVIIGRGAGNFAMYFPQNDYVGLLNTHGTHTTVIDKPHNAYLQTAVNTGIVGLCAVLAVFLIGIGRFVRFMRSSKPVNMDSVKLADATACWTFCAAAAFAVYSVANDSIVTVAPLFFIILGVQFAALYAKEYKM